MSLTRNTLIPAGIFVLGILVLSASGTIEKIFYKPVNHKPTGEMSASHDISVQGNITFAVKLPENLTFAGEPVQLSNMDVRERLDRELTVNSYWHSSSILMMKRANRWFPVIENILRENNVPDDFKYLALAESGLQNVVSPAGATGYWQFMKGAAKEHGLKVTNEVDERYHVEKATQAACSYLITMKEHLGSWTLAAAAYNMGLSGLKKQMDRQMEQDYYDLILSDETSRYVFRILALKSIYSAPHDFGFQLESTDMYEAYAYKMLIVDDEVKSWPEYCKQQGITYRELKLLNPWLREAYLTNTEKKEYKIKVLTPQ